MDYSKDVRSERYRLYLLSYAAPGQPIRPIGVLMFDPQSEVLYWHLPKQWDFVPNEFDREYLSLLNGDIATKVEEWGGRRVLSFFEQTLSNFLRLSELAPLEIDAPDAQSYVSAAYDLYVA
jgi:hypothetical protein